VSDLIAVAVAALAGFAGNELAARYRIRTGRKIGSAALVADGLHARTDGLTSLAVLLGAGGVALGWDWADPVIGLVITVAILAVLRQAAREIYQRLMDAVDPALVDQAEAVVRATPGVLDVGRSGCAGSAVRSGPGARLLSRPASVPCRPISSPSAPSMACCTPSRACPARWSTLTLRSPVLTRMTCWPATGRPRPHPDGHGRAWTVRGELRAVSVQRKGRLRGLYRYRWTLLSRRRRWEVLATMPPLLAAMANAGRHGVLVKSAVVMEQIGRTTQVAFDKTGTLTHGAPQLAGTVVLPGTSLDTRELLALAAAAENPSEHPLARAVVTAAHQAGLRLEHAADFMSEPGRGVSARVAGRLVQIGSPAHLLTSAGDGHPAAAVTSMEEAGQTAVVVLLDGVPAGVLSIADQLRPAAAATVASITTLTGSRAGPAHRR
jgi:haloacid dehalogenase-like hydrolase/Cation efflux family